MREFVPAFAQQRRVPDVVFARRALFLGATFRFAGVFASNKDVAARAHPFCVSHGSAAVRALPMMASLCCDDVIGVAHNVSINDHGLLATDPEKTLKAVLQTP